jgi:hypothetical protein
MDIQTETLPPVGPSLSPQTEAAIAAAIGAVAAQVATPGVTLAKVGDAVADATKPFWQSKTLIAGLVAKVAAVAGMVGISLDPQNTVVISIVSGVVTILGASFQSLFHVISTKKPV